MEHDIDLFIELAFGSVIIFLLTVIGILGGIKTMRSEKYEIQDHFVNWLTAKPHERGYAAYALTAAREGLDLNAVDSRWREFASALCILYHEKQGEASAAFNFCSGFLCALNIQYNGEK